MAVHAPSAKHFAQWLGGQGGPELNEDQVTDIGFASASLPVDAERNLEIILDAEPRHFPKEGLSFVVRASLHLCDENSCERLWSAELPRKIVPGVLAAKNPLARAFRDFPKLQAALAKSCPEQWHAVMAFVEEGQIAAASASARPGRRQTP